LESETSIDSVLPLYISSLPPSPPPLLPTPIDSSSAYNMSQINLYKIIYQQQEQLAAMQAQIQALLAAGEEGAGSAERRAMGSNTGSQMEVAKLAIFNGETGRIEGFVIICRLYLRIKMKEVTVEEQVQWVFSYI